jgi:hypothetical protein
LLAFTEHTKKRGYTHSRGRRKERKETKREIIKGEPDKKERDGGEKMKNKRERSRKKQKYRPRKTGKEKREEKEIKRRK